MKVFMEEVMASVRSARLLPLIIVAMTLGCGENNWQPNGDGGPDDGGGDGGADAAPGCVDSDGDGHGVGCSAGADCDDSDPFYTDDCPHCLAGPAEGCACDGDAPVECYDGPAGTAGVGGCVAGWRRCLGGVWLGCEDQVLPREVELCNGIDDNCDGTIDEGVADECGDCNPHCRRDTFGGDGDAWSPSDDNSEGVSVDEEAGGLVLDSASINTYTIWIANSVEGTVSKVDVRTYEELGRYAVGADPSRTSVNGMGDVFVGLRGGMGLTKISTLGERCPDTNGDGVITTSTGHDVLPAGQDDCVLWTVPLPGCGVIRGVAAQDVYGPDGTVHSYVWVGGWDGCLWRLDGETGEILVNATQAPSNVYGLALDGSGNLWSSGQGTQILGRVDTNVCLDDASCAGAICAGEGAGDDCVKQQVTAPYQLYGITVDRWQRVWVGGGTTAGGGPCRYDPSQPAGSRWICSGVSTYVGGLAADENGFIWASGTGWAFGGPRLAFRIDAHDPTQWTSIAGAEGYGNHGAAVDSEGKVWFINYTESNATVVRPGATLTEYTVETGVAAFINSPYTYSDMTGLQMRWATNPRGYYRTLVTGCEDEETDWGEIHVDAFTPEGTNVLVRIRTADDPIALEMSPWVVVGSLPDEEPPFSIVDALARDGIPAGYYLEVELQLSSSRADGAEPLTPVVYDLSVTRTCEPIIN